MLSSAASGLSGAAAVEPRAMLTLLKRGLRGPGFPQVQLRPDLPSLLLDHLKISSSGKSPTESLGKTGSRLWPERDADLFWKISWLLLTL